MPRRPRVFVPGLPAHVVQRGNNRGQVFFGPKDAQLYLEWLQEAGAEHGLAVHAYVLMTNHVHLLVSPETGHSLPRAMRQLNWRYSRYVNGKQRRTGSLWEGRYRACPVEAEPYFMACSRYIELNPVRAGLSATPAAYRWSSYKANALGAADPLVSPHSLYDSLGSSLAVRADAYRQLFDTRLPEATLGVIREAVNTGAPLGGEAFSALIGRHAGHGVTDRKPGRPRR